MKVNDLANLVNFFKRYVVVMFQMSERYQQKDKKYNNEKPRKIYRKK